MLRAATHVEGHDLDTTLDALGKSYSEKRVGEGEEAELIQHEAPRGETEQPAKPEAGTQNADAQQGSMTRSATRSGTSDLFWYSAAKPDLSRRSVAKPEAVSAEDPATFASNHQDAFPVPKVSSQPVASPFPPPMLQLS